MQRYLDTLDDSKSKVLEQYDALRAIWGDILQGFSYLPEKSAYVKHLGDRDHGKIAKIQMALTMEFLDMGVPTRQERLDFITNESEEWSQDDEDEISSHEYFISDNQPTYEKLTIGSQKEQLQELLETTKSKLAYKRTEKETKLGAVAETKAEKLANSYYIYYSFFKDEALTEPFWETKEEFDDLEDYDLAKSIMMYNSCLGVYNLKNFQKIAAMPFTLNMASYCKDQGLFFLGKPITDFTNYQLGCFTKIMRNTFILRESKGTSPEINNDLTMDILLEWYEHQYQVIMAENGSAAVTSTSVRG